MVILTTIVVMHVAQRDATERYALAVLDDHHLNDVGAAFLPATRPCLCAVVPRGIEVEPVLGLPRCAPQGALAQPLPTGEGGIGLIALAPALVAAYAAIGHTPVAMPHNVLGREVVTALALRDARESSPTRCSRHDPQVIQIHAPPVPTDVLDRGRRGKRTAARLV